MKAQLALMAAGTISSRGSTPEPIAAAARIGISSAVVAVLLVISVRNVTDRQITASTSSGCSVLSAPSASPTI